MPKIHIMGSESPEIRRALADYITPADSCDFADLLILSPDVSPPFPKCSILLIPDELLTIPECRIAVSYGMSSKCTVTLSSVGKKSILSVQREMPDLFGGIIESQDIAVTNRLGLSDYALMASSAALLMLGVLKS